MEKFIKPNGNFIIGLQVIPYDYAKYSVVGIRINYKNYLLLQEKVEWVPFLKKIPRKQELGLRKQEPTPQINEFIMGIDQVQKELIKISRDAEAGIINEEYFNNHEVDAERF